MFERFTGTDEYIAASELRDSVGEVCVPVLLPDQSGPGFSAVSRTLASPESDWCQRLKDRVMDACEDEDILLEYLDTQEVSDDQMESLMPAAIADGALVPILVCNPDSGLGVDEVLAFLQHYSPSPTDLPIRDADGEPLDASPTADLQGTVFNVKSDPHVGKICLVRIHSGTLKASDLVAAPGESKGEKLGGLFRLIGKKREAIESAGPGDVVAFTKVESLTTWDEFNLPGGNATTVKKPPRPRRWWPWRSCPRRGRMNRNLARLSKNSPPKTQRSSSSTRRRRTNWLCTG